MDENSKPQLPGQSEQPPLPGQQNSQQSDPQAMQQAVSPPANTQAADKQLKIEVWQQGPIVRFLQRGLYGVFQPYAKNIKIFLQMSIGVILVLLIIAEVISYLRNPTSIPMLTEQTLGIVGVALLVSTAFELAYTLFTPGPDEAVDPLITGLAAVILITSSRITTISFDTGGGVAMLVLALIVLFLLKEIFLEKKWRIGRFRNSYAETQQPSASKEPVKPDHNNH